MSSMIALLSIKALTQPFQKSIHLLDQMVPFHLTCEEIVKERGSTIHEVTKFGQHLLVYEFLKSGSLHDFLHLSYEYSKPLTWNSRVKIALGSARALDINDVTLDNTVAMYVLVSATVLTRTFQILLELLKVCCWKSSNYCQSASIPVNASLLGMVLDNIQLKAYQPNLCADELRVPYLQRIPYHEEKSIAPDRWKSEKTSVKSAIV
ncbi:hypothetical protein Vadar_004410 [Vaccinium darrowii]|uniref:Uncharacterized protein n=1 Tax=Vaccinium darrowii TaxID=229202 RepID=A0ACB7Z1U7_9ERIC|nr:hypothetical protein Vadar_004410 [Vaccinium darrowii]